MMKTVVRDDSILPVIIVGAVIVLAILVLVVYGLWAAANGVSRSAVNWWAVTATLAIVPVFFVGFWFGKTEARGILAGFDKSLDRMAKVMGDVATMRDDSHIRRQTAKSQPTQPQYTVVLPNVQRPAMPPITHRELSSGDETIDL